MRQYIEEIKANETLLAVIVRCQQEAKEPQFVTDPANELQLGILQFKKGRQVQPHEHVQLMRKLKSNQEFIYLIFGSVDVSFYFDDKLIQTATLSVGDCLLQIKGGHGFDFLEDSKIIIIKQGPYTGRALEKVFLKTAAV